MSIRPLRPTDAAALSVFSTSLTDLDRTFIRENLQDREDLCGPTADGTLRWIASDGSTIVGYAAVHRLPGWSSHVGELRLAVTPQRRGRGLGTDLARHALVESLRAGMLKIIVELAAEQEQVISMFLKTGFIGEALLRNHIRDPAGRLRDLLVLAHFADDDWSAMNIVGLAGELG